MLAIAAHRPFLHGNDFFRVEYVFAVGAVEDAALIDPAAEIGRDGDIWRGSNDALGQLAVASPQIIEDAAECFLGRHLAAGSHR